METAMLRFKYQTFEFGNTDIHLRSLRNRQEYSDNNNIASNMGISSANWSLFGVIWASEEVLAHIMFKHDIEGKKILEVGCGTALASLILNNRLADITATDYHPEANNFLLENIKLNQSRPIPFYRENWDDKSKNIDKYDMIIGSDLLYESNQADILSKFIDSHAKPDCKIIIVDPGRKFHPIFTKNMQRLGYSSKKNEYPDIEKLTQPVRGANNFFVMTYQRPPNHRLLIKNDCYYSISDHELPKAN
ncbi:MAG: methyltransferase domain-containing protein [Gammaproteobacteria bacterium]|nr:methyltransferase domain-containing protein [Gammaproteobacteria bacterium]